MDVGSQGKIILVGQNPNFVLNQARYQGAEILSLTRANFGCGSSL